MRGLPAFRTKAIRTWISPPGRLGTQFEGFRAEEMIVNHRI